jgi:DNA-binding LacI/PurR family transcriptional regulator
VSERIDGGNGRGVTLEEVARIAGVSRATVSRVVNGNPRVNHETRRVVEKAVARLGYIPNPAARSLVTRRSDSVALVIAEPTGRLFDDPFFPRLLRGVGAELTSRQLQLVLLMPQDERDEQRAERYLASGHVDGALLVSLHGDDPLPADLAARGIPVVVGARPPHGAAVSFVDVDNVQGARSAVEHLIETGRTTIATIAGPGDMSPGIDRLEGYRQALRAAGRPADARLEAVADFSDVGGEKAMRRILEAAPAVDGVFAASDLMAIGAIRALRAAGRRVPDDVGVVGYDDSIARTADPPLTSVRQPIEEMGREMTRLLVQAIEEGGSVPRRVVLGTDLIVRRSSGRAARA